MTGYVRQSAADIVPTAVVRAAPINNELNALRDAFEQTAGHKHDGTAAEGHYVPLIADDDAKDKVVVDGTNHRVGVHVNVSGTSVEQVRIQDGAIVPVTDNDIDLGTSSLEFKDLYIDGTANIDSLIADTADINAGTIDNTVIGATTPAAATVTNLTVNSAAVIASADINAGTIDNTVVGATTPAAATVTNLTVNSAAVIASADINAGTIDGAVIGGSSAQAITGTTVTATTGFVGGLTGAVTGNVTGNLTGSVTGNVTGNITGNVTASSGSSTFNDVVINGGLNMNAGTSATITNLTSPTNAGDAATKGYVDTSISNLIDTAPGTLDTLNELAAALGDDPNFATTVTNEIATKLALAGGTMSGAIAMGTNKITGVGDPTSNQDAATKKYVDDQDALKLSLTGGTMSGAIAMGSSKITGLGTPTADADATTKLYVDGILGSATSAATSAAAAATSASNASTSASNASTSASNASTSATSAASSATAAAASYDSFDDRYLGAKSSAPSVDNDGNALLEGAFYWNSTSKGMFVWNGTAWEQATLTAGDFLSSSDIGTTVLGYVAPGTSGNILKSNGTAWTSAAPSVIASATPTEEGIVYGKTEFGGNTSIGSFTLQNVSGTGNTAVGTYAYRSESGSSATNNTVVGMLSGNVITTGGSNATLGYQAARALTTGAQNVLLGTNAGYSGTNNLTTGSNVILIGYNAAASSATVSNEATIGNASITNFRIPGLSVDWTSSTVPNVTTTGTQTLTNKTISADSNTLSGIAASSFVLSNASGNIDGAAAQKAIPSGVVVGTTDTQTLTNKTLTSPVIGAIVNTGTLTLPTSTDTLVGRATTDTLTNKTISADNNTLSGIAASSFVLSNASGNIDGAAAQKAIPSGVVVGTTDTQTLTSKTIEAGTFTNGYTEETATANTGTAYTIDLANGSLQILTLTGNCTFTFPTATAGKGFAVLLKQDATGSRTVTWPASVKWPASTAPTITATASKGDKYVFVGDGTYWWGSNAGQNYL